MDFPVNGDEHFASVRAALNASGAFQQYRTKLHAHTSKVSAQLGKVQKRLATVHRAVASGTYTAGSESDEDEVELVDLLVRQTQFNDSKRSHAAQVSQAIAEIDNMRRDLNMLDEAVDLTTRMLVKRNETVTTALTRASASVSAAALAARSKTGGAWANQLAVHQSTTALAGALQDVVGMVTRGPATAAVVLVPDTPPMEQARRRRKQKRRFKSNDPVFKYSR